MKKSSKIKARFYGDEMPSEIDTFQSMDDLLGEANSMAHDYAGEVQNYGDEIVVMNGYGQEVCRWEIL